MQHAGLLGNECGGIFESGVKSQVAKMKSKCSVQQRRRFVKFQWNTHILISPPHQESIFKYDFNFFLLEQEQFLFLFSLSEHKRFQQFTWCYSCIRDKLKWLIYSFWLALWTKILGKKNYGRLPALGLDSSVGRAQVILRSQVQVTGSDPAWVNFSLLNPKLILLRIQQHKQQQDDDYERKTQWRMVCWFNLTSDKHSRPNKNNGILGGMWTHTPNQFYRGHLYNQTTQHT